MNLRHQAFALSALFLFCTQAGASKTNNSQPSQQSALAFHTLRYDGLKRSYYLHAPHNSTATRHWPVLLILHGGGKGDGHKLAQHTKYVDLAEQEGFIAVFPNGVNGQWNDGRDQTIQKTSNTNINDVGFISALIDHIIRKYRGDPSRVYVTGLSNGGMMTLRLGCELNSKLAAIAPVIANLPKKLIVKCKPDSTLPVLLMNGTKDPIVPWNGGYVHFFRKKMGQVVSTHKTIQFWVKHNQCNPVPKIRSLPDKDKTDGSTVQVSRYTHGKNGSEVILYKIVGGGHNFPGSNFSEVPLLTGKKNNDINGVKVIWNFLKQYSK